MISIGCVYSVEDYATIEQPLSDASQISYGLGIISTLLKKNNYDVNLFVVCPKTSLVDVMGAYIKGKKPRILCLSSVSSQYHIIENVAKVVKEIDPSIFVILGGYHASLAPDDAIASPYLDAICVGEGDLAIIELAQKISFREEVTNISNLWIKDKKTGLVQKNKHNSFFQELDTLPYIDRTLWEQWIVNPNDGISILVGRGCPYRCTYCSNHAMKRLAKGKFVRYRSPVDLIGEIKHVSFHYPTVTHIYLEVETIGASIVKALDLFQALAEFNSKRKEKLTFKMNLAINSKFMRDESIVHKFFEVCSLANVNCLNIGLEAGSERVRDTILRRPKYTNQDLVRVSEIARDHGIEIILFALIGIPGETRKDFLQTVDVVKRLTPKSVFLSIFYPYIGTDLYNLAINEGLLEKRSLHPHAERSAAVLDLPGFSKNEIRFEYIFFWYRVYKGVWPFSKIVAHMAIAFIRPYPIINTFYRYLLNNIPFIGRLKKRFQK